MLKKYLNSFIVLLFMFGFFFIPPFGQITEPGMAILGIFLGTVWGWCTVDFIWPSLLGMILLPLTGYDTFANILADGFGDSTVLAIFIMFIFFGFIGQTGCLEWIARKLLSIKALKTRPWLLFFTFLAVGTYLGGATNGIAFALMLWAMFSAMCKSVDLDIKSNLAAYVNIGIAAFCSFGVVVWPFTPYFQMAVGLIGSATDLTMYNLGNMYLLNPVIALLCMIAYIAVGKFIFRFDVSKFSGVELGEVEPLSDRGKKGLMYFAFFLAMVFSTLILPSTWKVTQVISTWGPTGVATIGLIIASFSKDDKGNQVLNMSTLIATSVGWGMLFMVISSMPICAALESNYAGIITTVTGFMVPIASSIPPSVFLVVIFFIFLVLTQVIHNLILLLVFTGTLAKICIAIGISPVSFGLLFFMVLQVALMTPGASIQASLIYGNEDIPKEKILLYTGAYCLVSYIILCVIGIPLGNMLFPMV